MTRFPRKRRQSEKVMRTLGLSQVIQTKDVLHCNLVTDFLIAGKITQKAPAGGHPWRAEIRQNKLNFAESTLETFSLRGGKPSACTDYKLLKVSGFFLGAGFFSGIV